MVTAFLKIRSKQGIRIINDIGIGRFLFVFLLLAGVSGMVFMAIQTKTGAYLITVCCLIFIGILHFNRKDLIFLLTHVEQFRLLISLEYIFVSIPVIAGLLYWQKFIVLLIFLTLMSAIVATTKSLRKRTLNTWLQRLIPDDCFEWKSGIRSSLLYLSPLYIIGLAASWWPGTIPVVMIVLGLAAVGFTEKNEPLPMLLVYELSPNQLLLFKIRNQVKLYSIVVFPLLLLYILLNPDYWYIVSAIYLLNIMIQAYAVLTKYSFYQPHVISGNQVFNILGSVSIFIPFLLPLILILSIRFYFRSVSNLNQYLYDYH